MTDTWTWATVTQATPLRIKVDGDTTALDATTDNLVGSLAVFDRVRVHLHSDGIIVTGAQGGVVGTTEATAATANTLALRDGGGQLKAADGVAADDVATVGQLGQWTAYTPTITGLTLGNGTATGRYHRIGDTVHLHISIDIGSTTTMGSAVIALPFATLSEAGGVATLIRVGGSRQLGQARVNGSTVTVYAVIPSTGYNAFLDASTPFTWTADSFILVDATYEAA